MRGGTVSELPSPLKADGVLNYIAPNVFRVDVNLARRKTVEGAIDRLIALLDAMDPDPDLEPAGDELDCAWSEAGPHVGGMLDEDAEPDDDDEDGGDAEPNGDEGDYSGGESDPPGFIWGGGEDRDSSVGWEKFILPVPACGG